MSDKLTRRRFLKGLAVTAGSATLAACQPQIVKETVIVEKPVDKIVKETVVVEKQVEKVVKETVVVEKVVEKPVEAPKEHVTMLWMGHGGSKKSDITQFRASYPDSEEWLDFEYLSPASNPPGVAQALRLAFAAGSGVPDLVDTAYEMMPEFALAGRILDLRGLLDPYIDDLTDGAKALAQFRGQYLSIPKQIKMKAWWYRKDLFENAGIDPNAVKTYEDFMAAGKAFREANPESYFLNVGSSGPHSGWTQRIVPNWDDARFADYDGNYMVNSHVAFKNLFQWLKSFLTEDLAFDVVTWSDDWRQSFANDKIGAWPDFAFGIIWCGKLAPEQAGLWDFTLWPEFCRRGGGGGSVWVPNGAAHPETAFEFARMMFLEAQGSVERWRLKPAILPVTKTARKVITDNRAKYEQKPDWMDDEDWKINGVVYFGGLDFIYKLTECEKHFNPLETDPAYYAEINVLARHMAAYFADEEELQESLDKAQSEMEDQIGNPYEV